MNPEINKRITAAFQVEGGGELEVATTRPETILGDTALAVHPEDPRYMVRHYINLCKDFASHRKHAGVHRT